MIYLRFKPISKNRWGVHAGQRIAEITLSPDGRGAVTSERTLSPEETACISAFATRIESKAKKSKAYGRPLAKMIW